MADNTENVRYSFQGDVKSLKQATTTAIQLLTSYQNKIAEATKSGTFSASARSTQTFNNAINKTVKDIEKMASKLKSVGDVKLPTGSETSKAFQSTMATVAKQMDTVANSTKITTKDLTQMKTELNAARSTLMGTSTQVDKLVSSEQRFQNVLGTVQAKAQQFRGTMDGMKSRLSTVFEPVSSRVRSLGGFFDVIKVKVQSFKDRAAESFSRIGKLSSTVASAFRRSATSSESGASAADRAARSHRNLGSTLKSLQKTVQTETTSIKDEAKELDKKNTSVKSSKTSHKGLLQILTQLGSRFASETKRVSSYGNSFSKLGNILQRAFQSLTGVALGDWFADATKQSIAYIENLNLFTVAMGEAVDEGKAFVSTMQELYGMDPSNLMRYAGNFYQLATAIDMPEEAATNLSLVLTKASNDIASLFNVDIETVFENMTSGMQGMSRAVRKYGMDIRVTTLQTEALALGITDQVESMSEANRMGLRFLTMLKQASNASGDFARTIETPANQLRIFREQMSQLGRAIGNFFIGPLGKAIAYVNGFIMAIRTALTFVAEVLGLLNGMSQDIDISGAEDSADAVAGIGAAASDAAKKMKGLTTSFDELNVLQDSSAEGAGGVGGLSTEVMDPRIAEAIAAIEYKFESIEMKANKVRDAILKFFGFEVDSGKILSWDSATFEENLINKFPQWTKTIQAVFDNWSAIIQGFKNVLSSLGEVFLQVKGKLVDFLSTFINDETVSTFISNLAENLNKLSSWISEHSEGIANFILILGGLWAGFRAFQGISALLGPLMSFISTCSGSVGAFSSTLGIIVAIVAAIALLYANSESFATSFKNLVTTVIESLGPIFENVKTLLSDIWTGLQKLWEEHVQPLVTHTGDALAPVLDTLGVLWQNISSIIADGVELIDDAWNNVLMPVLEALTKAVDSVISIFETLWYSTLEPIFKHISSGFKSLWSTTLKPIIDRIISIVGGVIELILALWNNVLAPIVNWLVSVLGPVVSQTYNAIWDDIQELVTNIGSIIDMLLGIIQGIIDFLVGVFTGDWDRAWKGLANVFIVILNGIINAVEAGLNGIIDLFNDMIAFVYDGIVDLANSILSLVEDVADVLGYDLDITIKAPPPQIPSVSWGRIPELATGGVVSSPTYAMIGEGDYTEAVIPLDNSPQMQDLVQKIADAVDKDDRTKPVDVRVFIGDREWDAFTYASAQRGEKLVGAQPIKIGG